MESQQSTATVIVHDEHHEHHDEPHHRHTWCCCPIVKGCYAIALAQLIWGGIVGLLGICELGIGFSMDDIFRGEESLDEKGEVTGVGLLHLLISLFSIGEGLLLGFGVKKVNLRLCKIWMWLLAVEWVLYMIYGALIIIRHEHSWVSILLGVIYLLATVVILYYLLVVLAFVHGVEDEEIKRRRSSVGAGVLSRASVVAKNAGSKSTTASTLKEKAPGPSGSKVAPNPQPPKPATVQPPKSVTLNPPQTAPPQTPTPKPVTPNPPPTATPQTPTPKPVTPNPTATATQTSTPAAASQTPNSVPTPASESKPTPATPTPKPMTPNPKANAKPTGANPKDAKPYSMV